jgi:hypothetical protein
MSHDLFSDLGISSFRNGKFTLALAHSVSRKTHHTKTTAIIQTSDLQALEIHIRLRNQRGARGGLFLAITKQNKTKKTFSK